MSVIKVGVVGCGDIARIRYFSSFKKLDDYELVGVYDWDAEVCRKTAEEYNAKAYNSLESFLKDEAIEAVVVATYHPSHADISIKALAAGKHVISEKPMCTSFDDALRIRDAVDAGNKIFMALPYDEYPRLKIAKKILQDGVIGKITSADSMFGHIGPLHAPWFFNKELAKWGVLADLGVYPISIMTYLFGSVKSVTGFAGSYFKERTSLKGEPIKVEVDDIASAVLKWEDNMTATFRSNWCTCSSKDLSIWDMKFFGFEGALYVNMSSKDFQVVVYSPKAEIPSAEKITYNDFYPCYNVQIPKTDNEHEPILLEFARAVRTGEKFPAAGSSVYRQLHVVEIIDKLYKSSATGKTMNLETKF